MGTIEVEVMHENSNDELVRVKDARKVAYARPEMVMSVQEAKVLVDDLQDVLVMAESELANRWDTIDKELVKSDPVDNGVRHMVRSRFIDSQNNVISCLVKAFDNRAEACFLKNDLTRKAALSSTGHTYYIERMIIIDD